MKKILKKYEQVIRYLFFGITTTITSWVVYFGVLMCGKQLFGIEQNVTTGGAYLALYTAAQLLQWIASVIVAFFTNRKWVFNKVESERSTLSQLGVFASGRLLTLLLDYGVTYIGTIGLAALFPRASHAVFWGREWNLNEITAKLITAVLVIIGNYFFSKRIVFKVGSKKENK